MWASMEHALTRAGALLVSFLLVCCHESSAQRTHRYDSFYAECTVTCGGGTQKRVDTCYTISNPPRVAPIGFCSDLPTPLDPPVQSCNTQPCTMCDRSYTSPSGTISSPYWPDKYSTPRYCRLVIDVEPEKRILLSFSEFTLEGVNLFSPPKTQEDVCLCGVFVEVRDDGDRLNRYCGTKKPFAWVSETDEVTVEFITPYSLVFNRFLASYSTIDKQPECYEFIDLTGFVEHEGTGDALPQEGFIHSLNFPNAYPDNQHCEYILHANPEHRIVLYFEEFELEAGTSCEADYVKVEDMYSQRSNVYCGKHHSFSWTSDSNEVWITFRTNSQTVYTGFLLAYELMDRQSDNVMALEDETGVFTSPGYPLIYQSEESIEYSIRTDPRNLIVITFHDFHLEKDDSAGPPMLNPYGLDFSSCVDYVKIIDIYDNHMEMYCGRIPVFSYISHGNEVLVHFKANERMNYRGFNASYRTTPRRIPNDWELMYRVAKGGETAALEKFLFHDRGYNEFNPNAQSTTFTRSRATYKHPDVPQWDNIGVRKVKVDVYTSGSIIATFLFDGRASDIDSWFDCERMIFSGYSDLNRLPCERLYFGLSEGTGSSQEFEITTLENPRVGCDDDPDHRMWLDVQDVSSPQNCTYEEPDGRELRNSIIFISSDGMGGETATGAFISEGDVFTIWVQRDCDQRINLQRGRSLEISTEGYGERRYRNNEYCDVFMTINPFDHLFIHFTSFELEEDECLDNDYVQIENVETNFAQAFCGVQNNAMWTTTGNAAILRFRTDSALTYSGWSANIYADARYLEDCSMVTVDPSGNVTNPEQLNFFQGFPPTTCINIIHAHPQERVILSFSSFIYQTENPTTFQIGTRSLTSNFISVTGRVLPFSWTSTSNELAYGYHAPHPDRNYANFEGGYRTLEAPLPATCQYFHDAGSPGRFTWPTESLPTGLQNCYVIVRTHPNEASRVQIIFRNLKMPQADCESFIDILDTTTRHSEMYCQRIPVPFSWTSDANEVVVRFFHGSTFALHQVSAEFRSRDRVNPEAAHVFMDPSGGSFVSPNYPHPYESKSKKEFLFHAPPEHLVILTFRDFSIEGPIEPSHLEETMARSKRSTDVLSMHFKHMYKRQTIGEPSAPECLYDFITVEDVLENTETKYCGDQAPFGIIVQGNEALVLFQTDDTVERRGFDARYQFLPRPTMSECGHFFSDDSGTLQSPDYPSSYPNEVYCRDVIQVDPKDRIVLNINSLDMEDDVTCSRDYLEVRDVVTGKMEKFCGRRTDPFTWTSDTNLVFVTFVSDATNVGPGYDASYSTEDRSNEPTCVQDITATSGTIHSPRFPQDYTNQLMCEFNITVEEDYGIQLTFQEFNLEPPAPGSTECDYDYLQIIDPMTENTETAEKLCGTKNQFERQISFNQVSLIFVSDFISFYKGFSVNFQQISLGQNIPSCDEELTSPSGSFSSPGYPADYPINIDCVIHITVAKDYRVVITFNDFNTEGHTGCPYDYVLVEDVNTGLREKFCGRKQNPFSWTSNSNEVSVTFKSDEITPSSGFYAVYESQPSPQTIITPVTGCELDNGITEIDGDAAIIQSPNYPDLYPLNVDCFVRFTTSSDFRCEIRFFVFNLEGESGCPYDFVMVTSIPDGASKTFCGSLAPFNWTSNSPSCEIHFRSDGYVRASGYHAEITAVPAPPAPQEPPAIASKCVQSLQAEKGVEKSFATPNWPNRYPLSVQCTTTLTATGQGRIRIEFKTFQLEEENCQYDYVQISESSQTEPPEKRCGAKEPFVYESRTNRVVVSFISDPYVTKQGFLAMFMQF